MTRLTIHIHNRKQLDDFLNSLASMASAARLKGQNFLRASNPAERLETQNRNMKRSVKKLDYTNVWRS
jgi:hypothetical protein